MIKKVIFPMLCLIVLLASCMSPVIMTKLSSEKEEGITSKSKLFTSTRKVTKGRYLVAFKTKPGKADQNMVKGFGAKIRHTYNIVPAMAIEVGNENAIENIKKNPNVEFVEVDEPRYAFGEITPWGVTRVKAPNVWSQTTGANVKVAVLDTGIDYNHYDLAANYKGGYDFVNGDSDPFDGAGHGTHCSGTIAGVTNNDLGVKSVAYNVDLYAVKVLSDEGSGSTSDILAGVDWAVANGMDIASMSLGGGRFMRTEEKAYKNAEAAGLLVICASGNDGATSISYPAGYSYNMAVGAIDDTNTIADFSNTGSAQDIVGPGVHVYSTVPVGTGQNSDLTIVSTSEKVEAPAIEFAPFTDGVTGELVYCGLGELASDFPAAVNGNIALIQRGNISFADKVTNAMNAGAVGAIIYNNEPGLFYATFGAAGDWIPSVSMSMEDGEYLRGLGAIQATITITAADFEYYDGTSMACPHVAAVAALVKGANPALTNTQIKQVLKDTAFDLGATGWDSIYGWGLVDAEAAVAAALGM